MSQQPPTTSEPAPKRTEFGLQFGALEVSCLCSDKKRGWIVLGLSTPKQKFQVYVTKTGKVKITECP